MFKRILIGGIILALALGVSGCLGGGNQAEVGVHPYDYRFADMAFPFDVREVLGEDVELNYWLGVGRLEEGGMFAETLEAMTGIRVNFINTPLDMAQRRDAFNLLLVSGNMPDIMEYQWGDVTFVAGGPDIAIANGHIMALNDLLDSGAAPNLRAYLDANPDIARLVRSIEGNNYVFPFLREDHETRIFFGPMMRGDWLEELNLEVPQTIAEWETVLTAFRDEKDATAPLSFNIDSLRFHNQFVGAFGVGLDFYVVDGVVKFGQLQPEYRDFLEVMNRWWYQGLLDNNIATFDQMTIDANVSTGRTGAGVAGVGGGIGRWLDLMEEETPGVDWVAVPYPSLVRGERAMFNGISAIYGGSGAAISAQTRFPTLAARLLDFFYSEEGRTMASFGTEGVTFEFVNGVPRYTDFMQRNPDGFSLPEMVSRETRAAFGPLVQDPRYFAEWAARPQQQAALAIWGNSGYEHYFLPFLRRTEEEEREYTRIMSDITTFNRENMMLFISGQRSLTEFDDYVATLRGMNIERAIEIQQAAYNRYRAQ